VVPPLASERTCDDDSLEELVEHLPIDLVLAEDSRAEGGAWTDELEHDFWADPCHFLRRACQDADYGAASIVLNSSESRRASR
jgi:hypothetical protein